VHERAVLGDRERVVEVLGGLRVDRERELIAQVDAAFRADRRRIVGLEPAQLAFLHEQAREDDLDPVGRPQNALDPRPPTAFAHERKVARLRFAASLAIEQQRRPGDEVRVADEILASLGKLDD
jgi:hypothetical protein